MAGKMNFRKKRESQRERTFTPTETIHVEKNLIIAWLLQLKHWISRNQSYLKNVLWVIILALLPTVICIFLYSALIKKQNYLFFVYIQEFNEVKKLTSKDEKIKKMTRLNKKAHKLCHTFFKTSHSYNGCLVEAATFVELDKASETSYPLDLFGQKNAENGAGMYALFFAAQTYENLLEFDKAYRIYHQLEESLKEIKKDDIPLFNKGKILFLQGKTKLAEDVFLDLLSRFPESKLLEGTRSFLNLIAFKKGEELLNQTIKPSSPNKSGVDSPINQ